MQLDDWSSGIGKHLLKVEDGKTVTGVFRGGLVKFYQHWKNGKSIICPGRETCSLCNSTAEEDRKATGRFRINFIVKNNGAPLEAKIFEGGKRVYEQIKLINNDVPLETAWVRISRIGTKTNTQWTIAVVPGQGGLVTAEDNKNLLKIQLHDLSLGRDAGEDAGEDYPEGAAV